MGNRLWFLVDVAHFDAAKRKLLLEVQACPECLSKDSIFRRCSSINFNDISFVKPIIGDIDRHEKPPSFARLPTYSSNLFGSRRHRANI